MVSLLQRVLVQSKGIWRRLDAGQRLVVSTAAVATVFGLGAVVWFAGQPSYEAVFTAATTEEIDRLRQAFDESGVAYVVGDDGRTFHVERCKVGLAGMAMHQAGLHGAAPPAIGAAPASGEDADTRAWQLDAACCARAEAAIRALEGVTSVTVAASGPWRAALRDRAGEEKARASVVLGIRPGAPFEPLARSAASLASAQLSVPLQDVEIVSASGSQRWRHDPDRDAAGGSSEFLSVQRGMSEERTRIAQARLDQLWPGKTSVAVTVELDPSWEVRSERMLSPDPIVRSEKISRDTTGTTGPAGEGSAAGSGSTRRNETQDREYVVEVGERRSGRLAPEIRRIAVAVLYDRSLERSAGFRREDLVSTVKAIVGWDSQRDRPESFSTLAGDFAPAEAPEAGLAWAGLVDLAQRWGPTAGQVLGVVVVVLFLRGMLRGAWRPARAELQPTSGERAPDGAADGDLPPDEQQKRLRREIERTIAEDPAALAKLFESWLLEQKA